ncbi:MAG: hypothetical protein QOE36_3326 [Gaiellaceae bacterium]|nr:hypothetical protein [Gaiellaceae bacterium]
MPTSSALDVWTTIALEAERESPLWASILRPSAERDTVPVFSALCDPRFALGVETIYEGYLVHYGRPRLFAPEDADSALLLGDYLYAHGLVRVAAEGNVDAVADLAELISLCSQLRSENTEGDGAAWAATAALLGWHALESPRAALRVGGDAQPLLALARQARGEEAVELALAAHSGRLR